jgi:PAS domain S-box-containing protein
MAQSDEANRLTDREPAQVPDGWVRRELLRLLVDNVRDYAMFLMDLEGRVLSWNEGAQRILQYSEAEIVGKSADVIFLNEDRAAGVPQQERVTALSEDRSEDRRWHQRKDGSLFWADGVVTLIRDEAGAPRAFGKVMRDSTDRKQSEDEIRRLLAETRAWAERESLINQVGRELRSTTDPDAIQSVAVRAIGSALAVDRCWFTLYDIDAEIMEVGQDWHSPGAPSFAGTRRFSDTGVYPPALFQPGHPLIVNDLRISAMPQAAIELLEQVPIRSGVSVPVHDAGALVASLSVTMADQPRIWTDNDIALIETVATQIRSALESARLRRRERAIATQLQEALTPSLPATAPGLALASVFRPALKEANVGGDFFDVFKIENGCVALVVGDVSGKGLEAAAQVATVRNTLRYALYRDQMLEDAITDLNRTIATHGLLSNFVTLFVGVFNQETRMLKYVSCGHEPTLIRRCSGRVDTLMPTGPVMGVIPEARYQAAATLLSPGEALIAYTDGLSDAGVNRQSLLGTEGLSAILEQCAGIADPDTLVARIMGEVEAFCGGNFHDDVCLLAALVLEND